MPSCQSIFLEHFYFSCFVEHCLKAQQDNEYKSCGDFRKALWTFCRCRCCFCWNVFCHLTLCLPSRVIRPRARTPQPGDLAGVRLRLRQVQHPQDIGRHWQLQCGLQSWWLLLGLDPAPSQGRLRWGCHQEDRIKSPEQHGYVGSLKKNWVFISGLENWSDLQSLLKSGTGYLKVPA